METFSGSKHRQLMRFHRNTMSGLRLSTLSWKRPILGQRENQDLRLDEIAVIVKTSLSLIPRQKFYKLKLQLLCFAKITWNIVNIMHIKDMHIRYAY